MCDRPRRFVNAAGHERVAGCRRCSSCVEARIRDWQGRVMAETLFSKGATFFTLTYGMDQRMGGAVDRDGAAVLTYSHAQKWVRSFRDAGYPCRYFIAGEYGAKKARAHWHAILFWQRQVPERPEHTVRLVGEKRKETCWHDPWWERGHTQWAEVNPTTARYLAKYAVKDERSADRERPQSLIRMSRFPLLGAAYFDDWARRHVEAQIPIADRSFTVPGSRDPQTGRPWVYRMGDPAARYVCQSFKRQWEAKWPGRHMPLSDVLERYVDEAARVIVDPDREVIRAAGQFRQRPWIDPPSGWVKSFEERTNLWVATRGGDRLVWSFDADGHRAWAATFVSEAEAERRRAELRRRSDPQAYRDASQSLARVKRRG